MKKLLLLLLLGVASMTAQPTKWSTEVGIGGNKFISPLGTSKLQPSFDVGSRYMFNDKLGVQGFLNWDLLKDNHPICDFTANAYRFSLEGVGRLLKVNKSIVFLHGGLGISKILGDEVGSENTFNLLGGVTLIRKIGKRTALKMDYSTIANTSQKNTLDGNFLINNSGVNSYIQTIKIGLVFYPMNHIDWRKEKRLIERHVIKEVCCEVEPKVAVIPAPLIEPYPKDKIFFKEGRTDINKDGLNAIQKVAGYMKRNPEKTVDIKAYSCTTHGSDERNQELSDLRAKAVADKLESMGINKVRISHKGYGKDKLYIGSYGSDLAKRAEFYFNN